MLVGLRPGRHNLHRRQPGRGERHPEPGPGRHRLFLLLEHPGNLRAEETRGERMVPHEPEKAGGVSEEVVKGLSFNVSI